MYKEGGWSQEAIGIIFGIHKVRVNQILRRAGVKFRDKRVPPVSRTQYIGVYLAPNVKDALKQLAENEPLSVSKMAAKIIEKYLKDAGVEIKPIDWAEENVALPFEEEA